MEHLWEVFLETYHHFPAMHWVVLQNLVRFLLGLECFIKPYKVKNLDAVNI